MVVTAGDIVDCDDPVIGFGTGRMQQTLVYLLGPNSEQPPDVRHRSFHGFITATADGSTKRVNALHTRWAGFRNDEFVFEVNAKFVLR